MSDQEIDSAFKKSNDWFFEIFNDNSIGMVITDLETTKYQLVNQAFLKFTGYSKEEVVGKTALDLNLIEPSFRAEKLAKLKRAGRLTNVEMLIRKKNGTDVWALVSVQVMTIKGHQYALTSFVDISAQKEAEALSAQLVAIVESSDDAIISKLRDGTINTWNKGAEKMFGYTSKQAVGKNITLIIPTEYFNEETETITRLKNDEVVEHYETMRVKKNGDIINVSLTVSPIKNQQGQIIGFSKIARDITDQKKASYARNLIEASLDPLVTINSDGKITDVNEASVKVTGITREHLTGTDFSNYFTDSTEARKGYQQVFEKGFVADYPLTIKNINGVLTDVMYNASVYKDNNGHVLGVFAAARDITHQKHTSQYVRSLIEASLDPLVAISPEGKIMDMNEALTTITGKTREFLIGTNFKDYFTDSQKADEIYQEVFAKGYVVDYPLTIKDHKNTDVLFNGSVYKNEQGRVLGAVVVARDITERKRIETELVEAKVFAELATMIAEEAKNKAEAATQIAEEAVRSKQQFLSNMSHEIRTPMNAIIGFTKVILKTELSPKQKEYLSAIKMSGDALIVLINDILDLAKVDSGKMTFEQTPFKMEHSISAMLHLFDVKIQEKNLKLIREYDRKIPKVLLGDAVRLHQIILNLVSNAVKFTSTGTIAVSVRLLKEDADTATVEFEVSDTGIGIATEHIDRIFENFQQASSGTSRLFGGTGLGLAIAKNLVEQQGGSIRVSSKMEEGSTFSFILSFPKSNADTNVESAYEELNTEPKNIKVLVVEDMDLNQLLMKTLLDDFGFERDIAANGKIAIEKLQAKSYDVILMDLQMPEMNGFEATEYIRNVMKLKTPIIALTADVTTVDLAKCKAAGMNDYIAKPVDEKVLYSKIVGSVMKPTPIVVQNEHQNDQGKRSRYTDLDYLSQRTKNDPDLMMEMISAYLEQTPPLVKAMKQGLLNEDWDSLHAAVHKMIPSFAIMGMNPDFEGIAKKVQEFARAQEKIEGISTLVSQLEEVCTQACVELEGELNRFKNTADAKRD